MGGLVTPSLLFGPLDVFSDLKNGFASMMGSTADVAGYLLGTLVVLVIVIVMALLLGKEYPQVVLFCGAGGVVLVLLIGFWPIWTVLFLVLILAVLLFRPLATAGGGE